MKYTTIYVKLVNKVGKEILGTIVVRDGLALTTFTDPTLAKQVYAYDRDHGEDVAYNEQNNAYIRKYAGKTKNQILVELRDHIEKSGGQILK